MMNVFVTRELYPFTAGGIGRVVANILMTASSDARRSMGVLYIGNDIEEAAFEQAYPNVAFLAWPHHHYKTRDPDSNWYPPQAAYGDDFLHWESVHIAQGLDEFARLHGELRYVEFTDWGAAAFAATQRKVLGTGFLSTVLAVRLHTTDSILADFEPRPHGIAGLALHDLERKALADCDLVIGQLASVAEAFRQFYGFEAADWERRLWVHAPPVLLDSVVPAATTIQMERETPLLFTSKLQDIKRPDVFVQGCVHFMREHREYRGNAVFLAHSFDPDYQRYIESLIPEDLEQRIVFMRGLNGPARERMIARGVCVFPSPWESFCLAAYEASLSGAACVLNAANPAFGERTPWEPGLNCEKFDGSPMDLALALGRLFKRRAGALAPVRLSDDPAPWLTSPSPVDRPQAVTASVDLLVLNRNSGAGLLRTLDSALSAGGAVQRIVIVDRASTDPRDLRILEQLGGDKRIVIHRLMIDIGEAASWNAGLGLVESELVAFARAGDRFIDGFVDTAARACVRQPSLDVVIGQQIASDDVDVPPNGLATLGVLESHPELYRVFLGEARLSGLYANRFSISGFVIRTAIAKRHRLDPLVAGIEVWEFLMRICQAGCRFAVLPTIGVALGQPVHETAAGRGRLAQPIHRRFQRKRARLGEISVPGYFLMDQRPWEVLPAGGSLDAEARLRELMEAESVRYTLALTHFLKRRAPWLLGVGKWAARRASRLRGRQRR